MSPGHHRRPTSASTIGARNADPTPHASDDHASHPNRSLS
jgi:hypothetical protein